MAMLHPDDEQFAHRPTDITPSKNQGAFHKVYFVSLGQGDGRWSGRDVVLRVARKTIEKIKTENEMAMLDVLKASGIPVPEVAFFCSDPDNPVGYEYNCLEKIPYPSLAETWVNLSPAQLDGVLDQYVDLFIKLFSINTPRNHGSLALDGNSGPVIEETMWTIPDIHRYFNAEPYNLTNETFATLNPTAFYTTWPAYISAFLKTYHHVVSIHPGVDFLKDILEPLQHLIDLLDAAKAPWVKRLSDSSALRSRLFHRDFHFGNILADENGIIKGIIDWEFAGIGVSFARRSSMMRNCVGYLRCLPDAPEGAQNLIDTWEAEFLTRLEQRAPAIAATWIHETNQEAVLGVEGQALSNVRECLRGALEVGVRGDPRVELARREWKETVVRGLETLLSM
ncbi:kinase-like domain-containing protein [Mycena filopes]|nr:kinase-like domain-containing protein [Mycena filopes]